MSLTRIQLTNFRNYKQVDVPITSDLVVIVGENASGKTNFLESVYYLSRLKSFRAPDNLLVSEQEDYFKIEGKFDEKTLEVIIQNTPRLARSYKIDRVKLRRVNWKTFAIVLFEPQDLNLFEQGPQLRRKFLNQSLIQTDLSYALDVVNLEHILKQRSALFKKIVENKASRSDLEIWDTQLAQVSVEVFKKRKELVEFISNKIGQIYANVTGFNNSIRIEYKSIGVETSQEFLEKLSKYKEAEIYSGQNLFGPHRDDFSIIKDEKLNIYNSSRGELRSQVLTLKLLQAEFLNIHKLKPVILLDDVFSELDEQRRGKLISTLSGHQIFITTTEDHHLPDIKNPSQILKVLDNQIKTA
jgi:DNA replication and repair protein RecF